MFRMQKRMTEVKREKSRGKKVSLSSYSDFSGPASTPMIEELIGDEGSFSQWFESGLNCASIDVR